jgi:hypothetical protein
MINGYGGETNSETLVKKTNLTDRYGGAVIVYHWRFLNDCF